jgi:hypothetical protein
MQYYLTYLKPSKDNDDEYKCLMMLSNYLCTLSLLQDRPFSSYRSSMIAASCILYANRLLNHDSIWTIRYIQITSYNENDLNECVLAIDELYKKTFHQGEITSSILRRYLKNENYQRRIRDIIHESSSLLSSKLSEDDDILDLTLDDIDEENMSMEHHR